jgi:molybdopterin-guanine dinucleotide biosynthesis protein A
MLSIAILCGGSSKRFAGDKNLYKINGKPLLEVVHDKFKDLTDDLFLQVSNNNSHRTKVSNFTADFHHDLTMDKGPLGGIFSALNHASYDHVFIVAGDLPYVSKNIFLELIQFTDYHLVVPRWKNGFVEPLCAIYSKDILPVIEKQMEKNDLKISNLYKITEKEQSEQLKIKYVNIDDLIKENRITSKCFKNINRNEDLDS